MLGVFRSKAQSPYIQATILIIILVFIFWGVGQDSNSKIQNALAIVNGETITLGDYQKQYDRAMNDLRDQLGGSIPSGLLETLNIKQQVVDKLINSALLRQGAAKIGLYVSDRELQNAITEMEVFKENGIFNVKRYEQVLAGSRMTVSQFESSLRYDLLSSKILDHLGRFGHVSPAALKDIFAYQYQQTMLDYVVFAAEDYSAKVDTVEDRLEAYFEANKMKYQSAPQVRLQYLLFPQERFLAAAEPGDEEISRFYQLNVERFSLPERRQASHILIRSQSKDSAEAKAAARKRIEEVSAKLKAGGDFAALARQYSEDGTAKQGGSLGAFGRGQMVKAFEDAVFAMQEGQTSEVVETPFGLHLIRLEKIEPAKVQPLEEVRKGIVGQLTSEAAKNKAFQAANETYEQIIAAGSLAKYGEGRPEAKAEIQGTELFVATAPPKALQTMPELVNAAFTLKKGELSSIIETAQGYAILMAEDTVAPAQQEFKAVRQQVTADYVAAESVTLAKAAAEALLAKLKTGEPLDKEAKALGRAVQTTPYFSRAASTEAKLPGAVVQEGLKLSAQHPLPEAVTSDGTTFYVLQHKASQEPDPALFESKKGELEAKLAAERKGDLVAAWLESLRKAAKITTNMQLLQ